MEWQPIATAPKDEDVYVLGLLAGAKIPFVMTWDADDGEWYTFNRHYETVIQPHTKKPWRPSHWMPLPQPPNSTPPEGAGT